MKPNGTSRSIRTLDVTSCPGCGATGSAPMRIGDHELRRCSECTLVHASSYGDPAEIYVAGYLKGETDFGLDLFHPLFQEFLVHAGNRRVDVVEEVVARPGAWLDVGCGSGELLAVARDRGWRTVGVEPVSESAEIARGRGLDIRNAMLQDADVPEGAWDVVSAYHVLEHMADGKAFLELLGRWTRPGGHVVVEVPNWGSFDRENHGDRWPGLRPLEHIGHYDARSLEHAMRAAGLEPVLVRSLGFLWEKQTLDQQLADLARRRWGKVLGPLSRRHADGQRYPGALVRRVLLGAQHVYDRSDKGQVLVGVARTPD